MLMMGTGGSKGGGGERGVLLRGQGSGWTSAEGRT